MFVWATTNGTVPFVNGIEINVHQMFHRCFRRRSKFPGTQLISASKGLPKHVFPTITCGHQFSRDDRSQKFVFCSLVRKHDTRYYLAIPRWNAARMQQVLHSITWILTFQRQPHAGWKTWEIVADLPGRIYQAFSSLHLVPLLHVNLSEVGEERYSKALQQNTPKMSHGPIIARSERDKNWKVVFINRRWTPILQPVKLFLARLFSSLKLLLKSASAFFSHPTWTKFSKDKFRFVHCGPVN